MVREPVHLSDWIQFLLTMRNISYTIVGVLLTIIATFIGFTLSQSISIYLYIETSIVIFFLICLSVWFTISKKSPFEKSRKLLKEILQNPDEIEVDEIRKEWYRKDESMANNSVIKKNIKLWNLGIIIAYSVILVIVSFVFYWYCKFNYYANPRLPPITTIAVWVSVGLILFLLWKEDKIKKIFGKEPIEIRKNIFNLLGAIFMSLILALTLSWNLALSARIPGVLYFQSVILIGLFADYVMFLYYILVYYASDN